MGLISPSNREVTQGHRQGAKTRSLSPDTLAKLVESSPDAMVATDGHGGIVWTNAQTEEMFGYSGDELLGQSVERLVPERFREILPAYQRAFAVEPGILRTGDGFELTGRRKDGTDFPIDITLSLVENSEEHAILLAIIRDITDRKRAEEERQAHLWFLESMDQVNRAIQGTARMAKALRPDVLIVDISMPRMGGVAATRIIRQEVPESEVIIRQNNPAIVRSQAQEVRVAAYVATNRSS
jgi:PAS domain S-box-containing protein